MKPLELTVYLSDEDGDYQHPVTREWVSWMEVEDQAEAKRFTDPELAAEYWRLRLKVCASGNRDMKAKGHVCMEWQAAHDELDIMQRFMELPHYDEGQP